MGDQLLTSEPAAPRWNIRRRKLLLSLLFLTVIVLTGVVYSHYRIPSSYEESRRTVIAADIREARNQQGEYRLPPTYEEAHEAILAARRDLEGQLIGWYNFPEMTVWLGNKRARAELNIESVIIRNIKRGGNPANPRAAYSFIANVQLNVQLAIFTPGGLPLPIENRNIEESVEIFLTNTGLWKVTLSQRTRGAIYR